MELSTDFVSSIFSEDWLGDALVLWLLGISAAVLSTFAYLPYIADTLAGRTQPQRASWLIWSVLGTIAFFSQVYEGATASLWFAAAQVSGTIVIFLLSFYKGQGEFLRRTDYLALIAAAIGLLLWFFTHSAAYALAITIGVSLLGGILTASKAYEHPESETLVTWVISLVAAVFAIISVGKFDPVLLAYPAYLFTLYTVFIGAIMMGRLRSAAPTAA